MMKKVEKIEIFYFISTIHKMLSIFRNLKTNMTQHTRVNVSTTSSVSPSSSEDVPFRKPLDFTFDEENEDVSCQKVKKAEPEVFGSSFSQKVDQKVKPEVFAPLLSKVEYIHFHNATPFPLMIDTWINTTLESYRVPPHHLILLKSSVGEWNMNTLFPDRKDRELWDQYKNLRHFTQIGKFRNKPCAQGNYAWMEYEKPFHCIYGEFSNSQVKGLITFSWSWRKEELEKENKNYC